LTEKLGIPAPGDVVEQHSKENSKLGTNIHPVHQPLPHSNNIQKKIASLFGLVSCSLVGRRNNIQKKIASALTTSMNEKELYFLTTFKRK